MQKERPGVIIYFEHFESLLKLSDEQLGRMFRAIYSYARRGEVPAFEDEPMLEMAWGFIQPRLDADEERYNKTCEQNREKAVKRWEKERNQKIISSDDLDENDEEDECTCMQLHADDANTTTNLKETTTVTVNEQTKESEKVNEEKKTGARGKGEFERGRGIEYPFDPFDPDVDFEQRRKYRIQQLENYGDNDADMSDQVPF